MDMVIALAIPMPKPGRLGGMKMTVQNGANHGLSRAEVEAMLRHFP